MNPLFALEYVIMAVALAVAAASLLAWRTAAKCRGFRRGLVTAARTAGILLLGLVALNPGKWREERYGRESEWGILVDRSSSMRTADVDGKSRWKEAVRLAGKARDAAGGKVKARVYSFAERLESPWTAEAAAPTPDGAGTDIYQAAKDILSRYRTGGKKLAGIVLISDGRRVGGAEASNVAIECRAQEAPIYVLPLGGEVAKRDLSISAPRKFFVTFVGQKLRLAAVVSNAGLGNIGTDVVLTDAAGTEAARLKAEVPEGSSVPVSFEIELARKGFYEYRLTVPRREDESLESNNTVTLGVAVLQDKIRVLVAEGTPGWDSKFFIQLLRKQTNMEVTSVYRVSSDRFFRVETDPSKVSEAAEAIFPDSAEKLGAYDVLIFGKGTEYFVNAERLKRVRDFVREQGGCLVFARGKPYGGRLPELEPLEPVTWGEPLGTAFRLEPARSGEYAGLFGDMLPGVDDPVWKKMPALTVAHRCSNLKAFSQVLAEGVFDTMGKPTTFPAIVSRRFGKGMILAVNAEGLWQWDFFPAVKEAGPVYRELWSQLLQWLVTYSEFLPGQEYALRLSDNSVFPGTPVTARISKRGAETTTAPVVRVHEGNTPVQELTAVRMGDAPNRWSAVLSPTKPGVYRVELAGTPGGSGGPCAVFQVNRPAQEQDELSADRAFLEKFAGESGGRIIQEDDLGRVLAAPAGAGAEEDVKHVVWVPLWDRGWFLSCMLACFATEWFVRRRSGLM